MKLRHHSTEDILKLLTNRRTELLSSPPYSKSSQTWMLNNLSTRSYLISAINLFSEHRKTHM